jgi:NAD-dependent SIR2 family protein deacetylase
MVGAGISVSSGIPDFRSSDGLYAKRGGGAFDPEQLRSEPDKFWAMVGSVFGGVVEGNRSSFVSYLLVHLFIDLFVNSHADEITTNTFLSRTLLLLGTIKPTRTHRFLKKLQDVGALHRVYSQNIDMLEHSAGIKPELLVEAHGSLKEAECMECKRALSEKDMTRLWQVVLKEHGTPRCGSCNTSTTDKATPCTGVIRPRVTFFGEPLPDRFGLAHSDLSQCELLIVMGTSLVVYPFAGLLQMVPPLTPRLLINRNRTGPFQHVGVAGEARPSQYRDAVFEGDCDDGVDGLDDAFGGC